MFPDKFGDESQPALDAFKAASLFSPPRVHELQRTAADLSVFPFISGAILANLKAELPAYLPKAADLVVSTDFNVLDWWN